MLEGGGEGRMKKKNKKKRPITHRHLSSRYDAIGEVLPRGERIPRSWTWLRVKSHASSPPFVFSVCIHAHCVPRVRAHTYRGIRVRLHEESHGGMRSGEPIIPARHATSTRTPSDHCALFSGEALPLIAHCIPLLLSAG